MELSEKIRILRRKNGWSQEELGYKLSNISNDGISRQAVSDWENGKSEPKLDNIRQLAELFNVSFDSLLNENIDITKADNENMPIKKEKIKSFSSVKKYTLSYLEFEWYHYFSCFTLPLSIVSVIIYFTMLDDVDGNYLFLLFISIFILSLSLPFFIQFVLGLIKHDGMGLLGYLNDSYLTIFSGGVENTKYTIPLENIIDIRLGKHCGNIRGTIHFKIKDKEKESTLIHLASPKTFIETFNKYKEELLKRNK